jgi:hypothetical protein
MVPIAFYTSFWFSKSGTFLCATNVYCIGKRMPYFDRNEDLKTGSRTFQT